MVRTHVSAISVTCLLAGAFGYASQGASSGVADQEHVKAASTITITGCIARGPDGKGFVLTQNGAPSAPSTPLTSSAAGTSATGGAPSGSVTGDTPTGTTATETAVPTPPVGEPGTAVNPSSPTYNQPAASTGTSGTVARADTSSAANASASYRLRGPKGVDLAAHVGHTVEVKGVLAPDPRAGGGGAPSATPADSHARTPELTVQTLTDRLATCTR